MSSEYNPSEYQPMIDAILSVADLDKISIKRIRNALQELFSVDLVPHKDEINDFILKRYYKLADERAKPSPSPEELERQDHLLAVRLQREESKRTVTRRGAPAATKVVKRRKGAAPPGGANNPFNASLVLSPQLQDVVGCPRLSRPQVVKQMWVYIRANNLQDVVDKRMINCDEKLKTLFKKNSVTMFEMNKLLSKHLYKEDEITMKADHSETGEESLQADFPPKNGASMPSSSNVKVEGDAADLSSEISDVDD